jgi:hypothetical protein
MADPVSGCSFHLSAVIYQKRAGSAYYKGYEARKEEDKIKKLLAY